MVYGFTGSPPPVVALAACFTARFLVAASFWPLKARNGSKKTKIRPGVGGKPQKMRHKQNLVVKWFTQNHAKPEGFRVHELRK